MDKKYIWIAVLVIILVAGGSFFAGTKYHRNAFTSGNFASMRGGAARGGMPGATGAAGMRGGMGGVASGSILSKDATSITVKLANGGSRIIFFSPTTTVTKATPSSIADLEVNDNVVVSGAANQDGSMNAEMISVK